MVVSRECNPGTPYLKNRVTCPFLKPGNPGVIAFKNPGLLILTVQKSVQKHKQKALKCGCGKVAVKARFK